MYFIELLWRLPEWKDVEYLENSESSIKGGYFYYDVLGMVTQTSASISTSSYGISLLQKLER